MNIHDAISLLESLLKPDSYINFIRTLHRLRHRVPEYQDIVDNLGGDVSKVERVLEEIAKKLLQKHSPVLYPQQVSPIPIFPFSKIPMCEWTPIQTGSLDPKLAVRLKYLCSRLGNLINVAFPLRGFILIDVDEKVSSIRKIADVETRRGFHIIRYVPNCEGVKLDVEFRIDNETRSISSMFIRIGNVDYKSSQLYYAMYPLQARYIEVSRTPSGVNVSVKSYKLISDIAFFAFRSGDIEPIIASPSEVAELFKTVIELANPRVKIVKVEAKPIEKIELNVQVLGEGSGTPKKESFYNRNVKIMCGSMTYKEFKEKLQQHINLLPTCVRKTMFEVIPDGYKFFHGCFMRFLVPVFVTLDRDNLREVIEDWVERNAKRKSDITRVKYYWLYFTGKLDLFGSEVRTPVYSRFIRDAFEAFAGLGYCNSCVLREMCVGKNPGERLKIIVEYLRRTLGLD